ncbi:MAG: cupin domain-containing protein [Betaproteobacteria bacterium]|jgi:mannose-6-phosphate isomerase-like protein (cupin superfamily)
MSEIMNSEEMEKRRIARWGKVAPYGESFIESRLPGFQKNLYKIINRGVLENQGVSPAIEGDHRFGVSLIEIPPGQGANLHSHLTEEVFFPLNGKMIVFWGDNAEHQVELNQWDCFSVPVGLMRGFKNPNDHTLVVYSVVGGTDAEVGRITWHPKVMELAEETGLVFDTTGYLKDKKAD